MVPYQTFMHLDLVRAPTRDRTASVHPKNEHLPTDIHYCAFDYYRCHLENPEKATCTEYDPIIAGPVYFTGGRKLRGGVISNRCPTLHNP